MKVTEIKKIACIGSGAIGASWTTNFIIKGYPVNVYDVSQEQLESVKEKIDNNLKFFYEENILTAEEVKEAKALVNYTTSMKEAVRGVQFIQGSGPERCEREDSILEEVKRYASPKAVYSRSTSDLSMTEIAQTAKYSARCIGADPYYPPNMEALSHSLDTYPYYTHYMFL